MMFEAYTVASVMSESKPILTNDFDSVTVINHPFILISNYRESLKKVDNILITNNLDRLVKNIVTLKGL